MDLPELDSFYAQYGSALFDRRCMHCCRFMKTPASITILHNEWTDEIKFRGAEGNCSTHGEVEMVCWSAGEIELQE